MRLCIPIIVLVTLACVWLTPRRMEPLLYLPTPLAKPSTMPVAHDVDDDAHAAPTTAPAATRPSR